MKGDTAGAANWPGAEGPINLSFTINSSLSLDVQGAPGSATTLLLADSNVAFGNIAIGPGGCTTLPAAGSGTCFGVTGMATTQVNLVAYLQAHALCAGQAAMTLAVYRDPVGGTTLGAGRVRFGVGASNTNTATGGAGLAASAVDWTTNAGGNAVQEWTGAPLNTDLVAPFILPATSPCTETWVNYELAARVLSTDTGTHATPVMHRLF